jgi:hypothetical protein
LKSRRRLIGSSRSKGREDTNSTYRRSQTETLPLSRVEQLSFKIVKTNGGDKLTGFFVWNSRQKN